MIRDKPILTRTDICSSSIAFADAIKNWGICVSAYPDNYLIKDSIEVQLQELISSFSLNSRRVLESLDESITFSLSASSCSRSGNIEVSTNRHKNKFIDPFAIAYSKITEVTPKFESFI